MSSRPSFPQVSNLPFLTHSSQFHKQIHIADYHSNGTNSPDTDFNTSLYRSIISGLPWHLSLAAVVCIALYFLVRQTRNRKNSPSATNSAAAALSIQPTSKSTESTQQSITKLMQERKVVDLGEG